MSIEHSGQWCIGAVIPAQNEEATLARCLASVLEAHARCERAAALWVVVVADACTDGTAAVARRALGAHGEVIECAPRSPGTSRRLGAAAVLEHFRYANVDKIWLANTDADSHVPDDWLRRQLNYADEGAVGIAGIVKLDADDLREDVLRVYRDSYQFHGDGTHSHVHGANLGVRADAYLDVGGWSHLSVAEDHCLWRRLKLRGWQLRSCVESVVTTSSRLHGRAVGGFADTLRRRLTADHG